MLGEKIPGASKLLFVDIVDGKSHYSLLDK